MKNVEAFLNLESAQGRQKPVVVVADDEPDALLALERLLRNEPYGLYMTTEPERAIEWIRTKSVSVVISDYRMPEMNGRTLLELVRAASPRTARLLLTAYPVEGTLLEARAAGLLTLLGKPWNPGDLKRIIRDRVREREIIDGL